MYLPVGNPSFERPVLAIGRTALPALWRRGPGGGCGIWRPPAGNSDYHDPFDGVQVLCVTSLAFPPPFFGFWGARLLPIPPLLSSS